MTAFAPLVSVVIPVFNRAASLQASIESVLRQTYAELELIIVDDCSTDESLSIARSFDDQRIRVLHNSNNLGAGGARNVGVAFSRGDWIAFQDSDDEWLPTKLYKQMLLLDMKESGQIAAYCGLLRLGTLNSLPHSRMEPSYWPDKFQLRVDGEMTEALVQTSLISTQTLVVRKDIFDCIGGFDPDTNPIEDWDFALALSQKGSICFVDEPLVIQKFSENSISRNNDMRLLSQIIVVEKHYLIFSKFPKILAFNYSIISGAFRRKGQFYKAFYYILEAVKVYPFGFQLWMRAVYAGMLALAAYWNSTWPRTNFGRFFSKK